MPKPATPIQIQPAQLRQLQQQIAQPATIASMPQLGEIPLPNPNRPAMLFGIVPMLPALVWFVSAIMWVALSPNIFVSGGVVLWAPAGFWLYRILRKDPNRLHILLCWVVTDLLTRGSPVTLPLRRGRYVRGIHAV